MYPDSRLKGEANLLIMPNLDAANISFNLLKMTGGEGLTIGPILLGAAKPVHILTPSATVRRLVNMTALCGGGCGGGSLSIAVASMGCELNLAEVYDKVEGLKQPSAFYRY